MLSPHSVPRNFADTGLSNDLTYYYRVWAFNADGASPAAVASAHTPRIPVAPGGLTATAVSGGEIDLAWIDLSDNESNFRIERSTVEVMSWTIRPPSP